MRRSIGLALAGMLALGLWGLPARAQAPFRDVPLDHWAYESVARLADMGFLIGYPDGTFKGGIPMTRYEFAMAIARLVDYYEDRLAETDGEIAALWQKINGLPTPTGPTTSGVGAHQHPEYMTDEEVKALLAKLQKEFSDEIAMVRADYRALAARVSALENASGITPPKLQISGDIRWRGGAYGSRLTTGGGTTGYPNPIIDPSSPAGNIGVLDPISGLPVISTPIPITDSLKDAFKASRFSSLRVRTELKYVPDGNADKPRAYVEFLMDPVSNFLISGDPGLGSGPGSVASVTALNAVRIRQAWFRFQHDMLVPWTVTVGQQFTGQWGEGLLVNNNVQALNGLKLTTGEEGRGQVTLFGAMVNREAFFGQSTIPPTFDPPSTFGNPGEDAYVAARFQFPVGEWKFAGNWLANGFGEEGGWGFDVQGNFLGFNWGGEYAQLKRMPVGVASGSSGWPAPLEDDAWTGWVDIIDSSALNASFQVGQINPRYALAIVSGEEPGFGGFDPVFPFFSSGGAFSGPLNLPFSSLYPYAAVSPDSINWLDRPLFLDPTNIAKGWQWSTSWHMNENCTVFIALADGQGYNEEYLGWLANGGFSSGDPAPSKWRDADLTWYAGMHKMLADDISFVLIFGSRRVSNILQPDSDENQKDLRTLRLQFGIRY